MSLYHLIQSLLIQTGEASTHSLASCGLTPYGCSGRIAWICCGHCVSSCWWTHIWETNTSPQRDFVLPRPQLWKQGLSFKTARLSLWTGQHRRAAKELQTQSFLGCSELLTAHTWVPTATSKMPVTVLGKDDVSAGTVQYSHALNMNKTICRQAPVLYWQGTTTLFWHSECRGWFSCIFTALLYGTLGLWQCGVFFACMQKMSHLRHNNSWILQKK